MPDYGLVCSSSYSQPCNLDSGESTESRLVLNSGGLVENLRSLKVARTGVPELQTTTSPSAKDLTYGGVDNFMKPCSPSTEARSPFHDASNKSSFRRRRLSSGLNNQKSPCNDNDGGKGGGGTNSPPMCEHGEDSLVLQNSSNKHQLSGSKELIQEEGELPCSSTFVTVSHEPQQPLNGNPYTGARPHILHNTAPVPNLEPDAETPLPSTSHLMTKPHQRTVIGAAGSGVRAIKRNHDRRRSHPQPQLNSSPNRDGVAIGLEDVEFSFHSDDEIIPEHKNGCGVGIQSTSPDEQEAGKRGGGGLDEDISPAGDIYKSSEVRRAWDNSCRSSSSNSSSTIGGFTSQGPPHVSTSRTRRRRRSGGSKGVDSAGGHTTTGGSGSRHSDGDRGDSGSFSGGGGVGSGGGGGGGGRNNHPIRDVRSSPSKPISGYRGGAGAGGGGGDGTVGGSGDALKPSSRRPISAPSDFACSLPEAALGRLRTVESSLKHSIRLGGRGGGGAGLTTSGGPGGGGGASQGDNKGGGRGGGDGGRGRIGTKKLLRPLF